MLRSGRRAVNGGGALETGPVRVVGRVKAVGRRHCVESEMRISNRINYDRMVNSQTDVYFFFNHKIPHVTYTSNTMDYNTDMKDDWS